MFFFLLLANSNGRFSECFLSLYKYMFNSLLQSNLTREIKASIQERVRLRKHGFVPLKDPSIGELRSSG